jgi:hypothetical protein
VEQLHRYTYCFPNRFAEPGGGAARLGYNQRQRVGWTPGLILVEKRCLAVADCTSVLSDIAGGVDAGGKRSKFLGFNGPQVMGRDPGGLNNLFEGDANPFPCGSQTKAGARKLRGPMLSGGRHDECLHQIDRL